MKLNYLYKANFSKIILCTGFLLLFSNLYAQDKVVVFFESGGSKIDEKQEKKLKNLPSKFNLAELDSVWFIGKADSLGKPKANIKLSLKRAYNVAEYCKDILPDSVPIRINGIGEKQKQIEYKDRSVTIVLFLKPISTEKIPIATDSFLGKNCYYIDDTLLARAHIRAITKNKKNFVLIEIAVEDLNDKLYYASENDIDKIKPKRIKWVKQTSGRQTWRKVRYQTTIPKEDFDKYRIFKVRSPKCTECSINLTSDSLHRGVDSCLWVANFLMDNSQIRLILFNKKFARLRVPIEYVDLNSKYYFDSKTTVNWESKKGKRNRYYYFTKIPLHPSLTNYYFTGIYQKKRCCPNYREGGGEIKCAKGYGKGGYIIIEFGDNYLKKVHTPYIGLLFEIYRNKFDWNVILGIDNDKHFYSGARFKYYFYTFPLSIFRPSTNWQYVNRLPNRKTINYSTYNVHRNILDLYVGAENRRSKNSDDNIFHEQNIHIGISHRSFSRLYSKAFVQYGIGYDFMKTNSTKPYTLLQFGIITGFAWGR